MCVCESVGLKTKGAGWAQRCGNKGCSVVEQPRARSLVGDPTPDGSVCVSLLTGRPGCCPCRLMVNRGCSLLARSAHFALLSFAVFGTETQVLS